MLKLNLIFSFYPWYYTTEEGGNFIPWSHGKVSRIDLFMRKRETSTLINNVRVHSLIFETPAAGFQRIARWDSMNHWTTTFTQAISRWPYGLHGTPVMHKRLQKENLNEK